MADAPENITQFLEKVDAERLDGADVASRALRNAVQTLKGTDVVHGALIALVVHDPADGERTLRVVMGRDAWSRAGLDALYQGLKAQTEALGRILAEIPHDIADG